MRPDLFDAIAIFVQDFVSIVSELRSNGRHLRDILECRSSVHYRSSVVAIKRKLFFFFSKIILKFCNTKFTAVLLDVKADWISARR